MRYYRSFEEHGNAFEYPSKRHLLRNIAVFFLLLCVIGTTFLNVAFTVAPITMLNLVKALIA